MVGLAGGGGSDTLFFSKNLNILNKIKVEVYKMSSIIDPRKIKSYGS